MVWHPRAPPPAISGCRLDPTGWPAEQGGESSTEWRGEGERKGASSGYKGIGAMPRAVGFSVWSYQLRGPAHAPRLL
jgi:hypothetical protein